VAQTLGCSLEETSFPRDAPTLYRLASIPVTARPSASLLSFQHDYIPQLARDRRVEAFTSGHGGDQVFCQYSGPLLAVDYAIDNGLDAGLISLIRGVAQRRNHAHWAVFSAIIKYAFGGAGCDAVAQYLDGKSPLSREARESVSREFITPAWVGHSRNVPPGKLFHIAMISDLQVYNETSIENVVADSPLLMGVQPLVELCLRTPTYTLAHNGSDRAVERAAFAARIPAGIVNRHAKGNTTRYFVAMLAANLKWLRSFLLDGSLASSGIVERSALESMLTEESLISHDVSLPLTNCLVAEAWVTSTRKLAFAAAA
jgi:asparagine synthase (glutamine-hydrolysing)